MLRLQNSPYFAYSSTREQSNKRSGTRLKTESETMLYLLVHFSLLPCSREDSSENDIKPASQMDNY